ncbi:MAG: adenylosuccinate synthase [Oscillospiraceae bacterium]|nr:adenylosuccinate synthase [Oscillospiraceae bacterium]
MVKAIVGANWGDEGKGKITDLLAEKSDVVVRYQGGANAGHTIICDYGRFALHQLPSGVFYPHTTNIIGTGVALDVDKLLSEIKQLEEGGVPTPNILVDPRTQVLMPYHVLQDTYEEERLAGNAFGSTKSGIAPFYSDKYAKNGIQISDLFDEKRLMERLEHICELKNVLWVHLYHKEPLDPKELFGSLMKRREAIAPYLGDTASFIHNALKAGKTVLLEGQLGSMKDPDHGIYPFTTSSHTLAGFGTVGGGVPPTAISDVICVSKAYSSNVGAKTEPFVSELLGEEGDELRKRGGDKGEFGATTGRPRRVGWYDAVASRYGCMVQGATEVALTAVDCLGYLDEIKICVGYEIDGKVTRDFPVFSELCKAKQVYEALPGWKCDIRGITEFDKLPEATKNYVRFIEKEIEVPIKIVSTGPKRHEIIDLH